MRKRKKREEVRKREEGRRKRMKEQQRERRWFGYRPACTGLLTAALMSVKQCGS